MLTCQAIVLIVVEICQAFFLVSFVKMNSAVPPVLASYIQQCIDERSLTLLTSTLDTPANWLLTRFLVLSLQGSSHRDLAAVTQSSDRAANSFSVIFVSVFRPLDIWSELARKCVS